MIPNPFKKEREGSIFTHQLGLHSPFISIFSLMTLAIQFTSPVRYQRAELSSLETSKHCWKEKASDQSCVLDYCKGVISYAGFGICYTNHSCLIAGRYDLWEQPRFNYRFPINYLYSPFILCQVMKGSDEQRGLRRGFSDHEMNWDFQRESKRKETSDVAPVGGVGLRIHEIGLSFPGRRRNT